MRGFAVVVIVGLAVALGSVPASAQFTSCALIGDYAVSAVLLTPEGDAQLTGHFGFTPPGGCAPGAAGTVRLSLAVLLAGQPTSLPVVADFEYTVDAAGRFAVPDLLLGTVAGVSGDGIANSLAFEADPALVVRFAGTATRTGLVGTGPAGPAGPQGSQGPAGPAGTATAFGINGTPGGTVFGDGGTRVVASMTVPAGKYAYIGTVSLNNQSGSRFDISCFLSDGAGSGQNVQRVTLGANGTDTQIASLALVTVGNGGTIQIFCQGFTGNAGDQAGATSHITAIQVTDAQLNN